MTLYGVIDVTQDIYPLTSNSLSLPSTHKAGLFPFNDDRPTVSIPEAKAMAERLMQA
jgi:hypothetical protein